MPGTNDLLIVWNGCCLNPENGLLGDRVTLSAAISHDDGKTGPWRREIESITSGNKYPALNIYDGTVYVTYRAQAGTHAISSLPPLIGGYSFAEIKTFYEQLATAAMACTRCCG